MFERFISRLDLQDMEPQTTGKGLGRMGSTQVKVVLNLKQKCYLVEREVEDTREDLEKFKHSSAQIQEKYKAILEEADIRRAEMKKAKCEFEHDIIEPLRDRNWAMVASEKVLHYTVDKMKAKDTKVERLSLKNQGLKEHARKLQLQLKQRKDMEETLNEVEYQQLKVKNDQCQEQIDRCYNELLQLKQLAGNAQQVLNSYKKRLTDLTCETKQLNSDTDKMEETLVKIEDETKQVEEEHSTAEDLHQKLCSQLAEYHICDVLEYVKTKEKHKKLQCSFKALARKVEIAEMDLKTHNKAKNKRGTSDSAANNTEAGPCCGPFNNPGMLPDIAKPRSLGY
ncbi:coiled-coil domain-containing protein 113 isoform X2 [Lampris incognitus]|uniref:coiled-coil domain-containing protein 113 isoform X2 n=1 Tax=Lampris incognitus TaxID=2546036 RepID=UPI0024B4C20D|nr:coiled-coil domain-containing protein 113 isoform X2 [Lampris incognitus]